MNGNTPLSGAAANGHEAVVKTLVGGSSRVDHEDNRGHTALTLAALHGRDILAKPDVAVTNAKDKEAMLPKVTQTDEHVKEVLGRALAEGGFEARQLRAARFGGAELRAAGYGLADLRAGGWSCTEARDMGWRRGALFGAAAVLCTWRRVWT